MQYRRRPWLSLLAVLAVTGVPAAGKASASNAAETQDAAGDGFLGLGLKLRPGSVITIGSILYDMQVQRTEGEGKGVGQLVSARLNADTYVYQPWFATAKGAFTFTTSRSTESFSGEALRDPSAAPDSVAARERFVTGSGRLSMFPRSRFPLEIHVERSDSRIDSGIASTLEFRTQSIGFSQRYSPPKGEYMLTGSYDRRDQWAARVRDTQHSVSADFSTRWRKHDIALGGAWNQVERRVNSEQSEFRTLVGRHNYSPARELSLSTTANWSQTLEHLSGAEADVTVLQWSTVGVWQREKSPWMLTGTVRGLALRDRNDARDTDMLGMTVGAAYELNRNARVTANGSASFNSSGTATSRAVSGAVGASWQGDGVEFKGLRYEWFASGNAGASFSDSSDTAADAPAAVGRQNDGNLGIQVGHTVRREHRFGSRSELALNAGQTLAASASYASGTGSSNSPANVFRTLQHHLAATWSATGDSQSAFARASYNDTVEFGGDRARFQLLNFQLSGNCSLDRNRTIGGDLTWQRAQQSTGGSLWGSGADPVRQANRSVGGEITYRHQRLFGFPRLRLMTRLKLAQDVLHQPGVLPSIPDRETRMWESRLDWSVGRLDSSLVLRVSEVEGRRREFLTWRLERHFGN